MKKICTYLLIFIFIAASGIMSYLLSKHLRADYLLRLEEQQNSKKSSMKATDETDVEVYNNHFSVYSIVGISSKLTKGETSSMDEWRNDIVKLAENNTTQMFINGFTDKKVVALTFDDGPDGNITPQILDILKNNNIHASFFFIGNRLETFKGTVKRAYDEGNLVLSHSWSHSDFSQDSDKTINDEITMSENALYKIIGKKPAIIRPPYGSVDVRVLNDIKNANDKIVIWSIDTLDWSQKDKDNIVKNVTDNVRPGDIILMHSNEDKKTTVEALPILINLLKEEGYSFVDLGELLNVEPYK